VEVAVIRHRKNVAESGMPILKTQPIALAFSISAAKKKQKKRLSTQYVKIENLTRFLRNYKQYGLIILEHCQHSCSVMISSPVEGDTN